MSDRSSITSPPAALGLKLAWRFTEALPGTFERDREEVRGLKFPLVGPLPPNGRRTSPMEGSELLGPYLYVLENALNEPVYIGVATEKDLPSPLARWIRPDAISGRDVWAHGTNKKKEKPTVVWLHEGLVAGEGPYNLYFTDYASIKNALQRTADASGLPFQAALALTPKKFVEDVEHALIHALQTKWNAQKRKSAPPEPLRRVAIEWYGARRT